MMDYRKAYGLPERYFLSLGRMVEKKNLSTLVEAYARFARESVEKHGARSREHGEKKHGAGSMEQRANLTENCKLNTEHCAPALVFVGSGELEGALREQARALGLRVVDRTDWKAGQSSHGLGKIGADLSERLAADRTGGDASCRVTPAVGGSLQKETDDCEPTAESSRRASQRPTDTDDSGAQGGAVFFYGFRQIEENAVFYALAEAFVLPSLKEEWGLVVNEAMAAGLPVIVSHTAGCAEDLLPEATASRSSQCSVSSDQFGGSETTENCKPQTENSLELRSNGFVFDPKSVDALSEALWRVAEMGDRRSEMGRFSREIVAKFSCENFAKQAMRAAEAASA
jgi:glycosyltransferase involved in cell wall biosynthesis